MNHDKNISMFWSTEARVENLKPVGVSLNSVSTSSWVWRRDSTKGQVTMAASRRRESELTPAWEYLVIELAFAITRIVLYT